MRARADTVRALSEARLRLSVLAGAIAAQPVIYGTGVTTSPVGIDADAFRRQAAPVVAVPGFRAVLWAPRSRRAADGVHGRDRVRPRVSTAPARDRYPVAYAARTGASADDRGLDLAEPGPAGWRSTGPSSTARPQLVTPSAGPPGRSGMLLIVPVFGASGARGVVAGVLQPDVLRGARAHRPAGAGRDRRRRADGSRRIILRRGRLPKDPATAAVGAFGQTWLVSVAVPPATRTDLLPVLALATMVLLLAAAAACALFLSMMRRSRTVERLVADPDARGGRRPRRVRGRRRGRRRVAVHALRAPGRPPRDGVRRARGSSGSRAAGRIGRARHHAHGVAVARASGGSGRVRRGARRTSGSRPAARGRPRLPALTGGHVRHVREKLVPLRGADGRLLVHGILSDITDVRARRRRRSGAAAPTR